MSSLTESCSTGSGKTAMLECAMAERRSYADDQPTSIVADSISADFGAHTVADTEKTLVGAGVITATLWRYPVLDMDATAVHELPSKASTELR